MNRTIGMMKSISPFLMIIIFLFCTIALYSENDTALSDKINKDIKVVEFDKVKPLLEKDNDTIYVVNFWATWCAPCIKEIPYFEQLGEKYNDKNLKILMISLDMSNQIESSLIPFIEKNNMKNEVILLDDPDFNSWIPLVDKNWQGGIPATLIYGNGFREFYPRELTYEELENIVVPLLSN